MTDTLIAAAQTPGPGGATSLTPVRGHRGISPPAYRHEDRVNTERRREVRA